MRVFFFSPQKKEVLKMNYTILIFVCFVTDNQLQ